MLLTLPPPHNTLRPTWWMLKKISKKYFFKSWTIFRLPAQLEALAPAPELSKLESIQKDTKTICMIFFPKNLKWHWNIFKKIDFEILRIEGVDLLFGVGTVKNTKN